MSFPIGFATGSGVPSAEEMDAAKAFGAKFIRCGLPWDSGSAAPDRNFDTPTAIRNAISYANSIGLGIILQIGAGTTYGGSMYTHAGPGGFDVLTEFSLFCANVIRDFTGPVGAPDHLWAVEIANEANHAKWNDPASPYFVHWTGTAPTGPQRYAETFLRIVSPAFENVRATAGCPPIITTGLGGESDARGINSYDFTVAVHQTLTVGATTFTGGLWPNGGNPWYSGYDLHPYFYPTVDPANDTSGGWNNMRQIMAWFQTNRGRKPPLWITEVGYPTKPETLTTCLNARSSLQLMVADLDSKILSDGWDIRSFAWFSMMNNNKVDDSGNDNYFGIVDRPLLGGTDPQNGPHKPSAAIGGTGQLFDKFVELATRNARPPLTFPLYGVTLDSDSGASALQLTNELAALKALPHKPTVRIVCDPHIAPSEYRAAVDKFKDDAFIMLMPVDSTAIKTAYADPAAYAARFTTYLNEFEDDVDIWEIGNELGGSWTFYHPGNTRLSGQQLVADKVTAAYDVCKARGVKVAVTLWEDNWGTNYCGAGGAWEMHPQEFSALFPAYVKTGTDFLFISWYPTACSTLAGGNQVAQSVVTSEFVDLHGTWPNAKMGFGEIGFENPIPAGGSQADGDTMAKYYYRLDLNLAYFLGGYFWWYFGQDAVPNTKPMWTSLSTAMGNTATYGTASFAGGGKTEAFGTGHTVVVPNTGPGAVASNGTATSPDVTAALNAFIDAQPDNTRIRLQPSPAVYHCEQPVRFTSRRGICLDGRGATIQAFVDEPKAFTITDGWIKTQAPAGSSNQQHLFKMTAAEPDFSPLNPSRDPYSWYVTGDDMPGPQPAIQRESGYVSDTEIILVQRALNAGAQQNLTIKFASPVDRTRANIVVTDCDDMLFKNLKVVGPKPAVKGYDPGLEAQHGFDIVSTRGVTVKGCTIHGQWGDGISLTGLGTNVTRDAMVCDNQIFAVGRHGFNLNGATDVTFTRNSISAPRRHTIDIEPNGEGQTVTRITMNNNDFGSSGTGTIAISGYGNNHIVGDIRFATNRIVNNNLITPVGNNQTKDLRRWGPFWIVNNTCDQPQGTGIFGQPDDYYTGKFPYATFPSHWAEIPAIIKFQFCDGITVTGNVIQVQDGRNQYAVWAQTSTDVQIHDNHDHTPTDTWVLPAREKHVIAYNQGVATLKGGGAFSASGASVPSTRGSAAFFAGGTFPATGKGRNFGTATFKGGATFSSSGKGRNYGTASFDGGATFSGRGFGQNFGAANFSGGGDFPAVGKGRNHGTASFDGGGRFTAAGVGHAATYGTASFSGGATFTATGIGQNFGRASFDGGAFFTARGSRDNESGYQDGEWCSGHVKLRGPGWDETRWDIDPWDGEE